MEKSISRNLVVAGVIIVALTVLVIVIRSITDMTLLVKLTVALMVVFSFYHGVLLYGLGKMFFFVGAITVISWSYESLSILTGFPFGNYDYTDLLLPKLGLVPVLIMPAYFSMGYLAWVIAAILLDKRDSSVKGSDVLLLPIISSFIMVMWDICMDPYNSTIIQYWIWKDGGAYFGVPLVNYLGWYLCVFTFYLVFALVLRADKRNSEKPVFITNRAFWILPVLMYVVRTIEYFVHLFRESVEVVAENGHVYWTGDIYGTLALMTIFTMHFVSFYAIVRVVKTPI
jgi:putative membrane protein